MNPYLKVLARFRNKIDFEISKQSNAISFDFMLRNYAKGNLTDEDLIELRGYYKGLKVAREMLYRTISEQKEMEGE